MGERYGDISLPLPTLAESLLTKKVRSGFNSPMLPIQSVSVGWARVIRRQSFILSLIRLALAYLLDIVLINPLNLINRHGNAVSLGVRFLGLLKLMSPFPIVVIIMVQFLQKSISFAEFIQWKPANKRYELHDGVIIEMPQPTGEHEDVVGFLAEKLTLEYVRLQLPYSIPKTALVKSASSESAYSPDILLINRLNLSNEPLWKKESTLILAASIPLVIEVVSSNWRDDYYKKYGEYEGIGIPEYWIVDYLALGGRKFIGNPKQPTVSIYVLVEGEYQVSQFRGNDCIQSVAFPNLQLTAEQIFQSVSC
jgi:Uma2 family endonuclease